MSQFTRADLGKLPADATLELPLLVTRCPRRGCDALVYPFEQATWPSWYNPAWIMQLCHYECPECGCVWGSSYPVRGGDYG